VVSGSQVQISTVMVSHGGLSLRVLPKVVPVPDPDNARQMRQQTVWYDPVTKTTRNRPPEGTTPTPMLGSASVIGAASVDDIANALNALGARPKDMVAIFEAIHRAGALHAELVVM
jgi:flagellar P-ring protein precursor FlgI